MESGFILVKINNAIILSGVKILKGREGQGKGKRGLCIYIATINPDAKCNYFTGYTKDKYPYKCKRT